MEIKVQKINLHMGKNTLILHKFLQDQDIIKFHIQ